MLPDAILAAWRAWLVWCQISQTCFVLLMLETIDEYDSALEVRTPEGGGR
jgi:hypothetical protein